MEMADYERLVKELNAKLQAKDESGEELKGQISTLAQKEETLKQEIGTWETLELRPSDGDKVGFTAGLMEARSFRGSNPLSIPSPIH